MVFLRPVVVRDGAATEKLSLDRYDLMRSGQESAQPAYNFILPINESAKLPLITEITPNAGVIGETITIRGKNFQDNLDNIYIYIIDEDQDPVYEYGDKEKYTAFLSLAKKRKRNPRTKIYNSCV